MRTGRYVRRLEYVVAERQRRRRHAGLYVEVTDMVGMAAPHRPYRGIADRYEWFGSIRRMTDERPHHGGTAHGFGELSVTRGRIRSRKLRRRALDPNSRSSTPGAGMDPEWGVLVTDLIYGMAEDPS